MTVPHHTVRAWANAMRADADHIDPNGSHVVAIDRLEPDERAKYRRFAAHVLDAVGDEMEAEAT